MEDLRSDSMFNHTGGTPSSPQSSRRTIFTSTKVPRFAGTTSWEQYRQVFDAIVISNGWDDATAALQLLSHLEGDALNVPLLVPATRWASRVGLVDALTAHYGSPGRLADYRRQFEKISRAAGTDPSIFAIELETLAMKAFVDMGHMARLRLVRDCFIAGQYNCALRRHLDSVSPETPIRDIVDRCRVWESHADLEDQRAWYPSPRRSIPVYTINDGDDLPGAADDITPAAQELLESLLQHLLPTPVVSPPKVAPIPSELELLIQRLIGNDRPVQPAPTGRSSFTDMEVLIQNLVPVGPSTLEQTPRDPGLVVGGVFLVWQAGSCGLSVSHSGCYVSFFAAGMAGGKGGRRFCHAVTPDAGRATPDGKRRLIRGRGSIARISNYLGPQDPADGHGIDMSVAREHDVPRGGLRRLRRLWFHRWEPLWRALGWITPILMCLTVGRCLRGLGSHRLGPMYIVLGWIVLIFVYLTVFLNCWRYGGKFACCG